MIGVLLLLAGCSNGAPNPDEGTGCVGSCENNLWPRLVVGVKGTDAGIAALTASADYDQGGTVAADAFPICHTLAGRPCTFTFEAGPSVSSAVVHVFRAGQELASTTVSMAGFNSCGRDIRYIPSELMSDGGLVLYPDESVDGCQSPGP